MNNYDRNFKAQVPFLFLSQMQYRKFCEIVTELVLICLFVQTCFCVIQTINHFKQLMTKKFISKNEYLKSDHRSQKFQNKRWSADGTKVVL